MDRARFIDKMGRGGASRKSPMDKIAAARAGSPQKNHQPGSVKYGWHDQRQRMAGPGVGSAPLTPGGQAPPPRRVRPHWGRVRGAGGGGRAGWAGQGRVRGRGSLASARGTATSANAPLRDALAELIRAAGLVRRIGVNLNQAVAKLNATGQRAGDLLPYAAESLRRAERLDAAAEEVRKALR
jgi:hypothetical protein